MVGVVVARDLCVSDDAVVRECRGGDVGVSRGGLRLLRKWWSCKEVEKKW